MKVKVTKNGPYMVSGNIPLDEIKIIKENGHYKYAQGKKYDTKEKYFLCRCGKSSDKPFCDGTHAKKGFEGTCKSTNIKYEDNLKRYENDYIILLDNEDLCSSARFCTTDNTDIWSQIEENKKENIEQIKKMAFNCPSGRLTLIEKEEAIEPNLDNKISIIQDVHKKCGSALYIQGDIEVLDEEDMPYENRNRTTLCRCGKSRNKPYCDGSHIKENFQG